MPSVATAAKLSMHNKQAYEWDIQTDRQTDRQRSMLSTPSLWVDAHNKFKAIVSSPSQVTSKQVLFTPLSSSSIVWYWPKGGDVAAGKVTAGLEDSNASYSQLYYPTNATLV